MKREMFILIAVFSAFIQGFSQESFVFDFRLSFDPEKLFLSKEGIFLKTEDFGEVFLENIHIDEKGYYTTCNLAYLCTECREFSNGMNHCSFCGSENRDIIELNKKNKNQYMTASDIVCTLLKNSDPSLISSMNPDKGKITGSIDDEGNKSLETTVTHESQDGNIEFDGTYRITQDSNGEVHQEGEVSVTWHFK